MDRFTPKNGEEPAVNAQPSALKEEVRFDTAAASRLLKAMSHESRLLILCLLTDGEKPVAELEQALAMRQPAVSQQLARLRADDLVRARRDGKAIYYSLASKEVHRMIALLSALFRDKGIV